MLNNSITVRIGGRLDKLSGKMRMHEGGHHQGNVFPTKGESDLALLWKLEADTRLTVRTRK